jgi:predicted transcriptional regulator of viral defense system
VVLEEFPVVFTAGQARERGLSDWQLARLMAAGDLEQLGRGLYRRVAAASGDPDLVEIAARAPEATLCLTSALVRHGLSDEIPASIDVALPRAHRAPRTSAPATWHRFDEATFEVGRDIIAVGDGLAMGLYEPERTICDVFRLKHREGVEVANEALRRWLRWPEAQPSTLLKTARVFGPRAVKPIRQALAVLL